MASNVQWPANPYVGPRAFQPGERLYGRDDEVRVLTSLLVAERIVLLHAPSGAGKTSLIHAALIPSLAARDFYVRPVMRVGLESPLPGVNRYLLSALMALEEGLPTEQLPLEELAGLSLSAYLTRRPPPAGTDGEVLIFDQFEELLTVDQTDQEAKQVFVAQVGEALHDLGRWALFAMREDYIAGLEPLVLPIPTRLNTTYRLDLLSIEAARVAMTGPASACGVAFHSVAAERLAVNLSLVSIPNSDGTFELRPGPTVEPVQLQVVCFRLWERVSVRESAESPSIGEDELKTVGDVDRALAHYYDERVALAAAATTVPERTIRAWFDRELITPQGLRGQILQERETSRGLPSAALPPLVNAYLVRAERRRGVTWLELTHDRLVAPVRTSNIAWFQAHLSTLQRQADLWDQEGRPVGLLLRDEALAEAETWANTEQLTDTESDFLQLCLEARAALDRERGQARRIRLLAIVATIVSIVALAALAGALVLFQQAERAARQSRARELAAAAVSQLPVDPELSVLLAREAVQTTRAAGEHETREAYQALQQAVQSSRVRRVFQANARGLQALALSPDGMTLATSGNDDMIRLWDVTTGQERQGLTGDTRVGGVAFSPDGAQIAAASGPLARIWDVANGQLRLTLEGHDDEVLDIAFSPDGAQIATASRDGTARLWDAVTGAELAILEGHVGEVNAVAFSPDGELLATAGDDAFVLVWERTTSALRLSLAKQPGAVRDVAFSPDGVLLATAGEDTTTRLWNADDGTALDVLRGHSGSVESVAFNPDGDLLATTSQDGTVRLWSFTRQATVLTLAGHRNWVDGVAFTPDGDALLTSSQDGTARLWSLGLAPADGAFTIAYDRAGTLLATAGMTGVRVWDAATGMPRLLLSTEDEATDASFSPDGGRLVSADYAGHATVWDVTTGEPLLELPHDDVDWVSRALFSPDGATIATAAINGDKGLITVWDAETGDERFSLAHPAAIYALALSPDGRQLAGGDVVGRVTVWDAERGNQLHTFLTANEDEVNDVAFSPDSARLAAASAAGLIVVWDVATEAEQLRRSLPVAVESIAFSPDGTLIATAGDDGIARLWDAVTGAERRAVPHGVQTHLYRLAFSPDGRRLATAGGIAQIFPLELNDLLALADQHLTRGPTEEECALYQLRACLLR